MTDMLSFLNNIPSTGNGKTGPTGNSVQSTSSGEGTKTFCNGNTAGKKRKKGKQPASAAKMPKLTSTATRASTATLEPGDIMIPKAADKSDDSDMKSVTITKMDSPLFKEIPSQKVESVFDVPSSRQNSSLSDDSSSSENDCVDEETGMKDSNTSNTTPEVDETEESSQMRTPIKLTISNLGKPSASVISTAALNNVGTASSDLGTEEGNVDDVERATRFQQHHPTSQRRANGNSEDSHTGTIPVIKTDKPWTNSMDNYFKNVDSSQLQNNSKLTLIDKSVGSIKDIFTDTDVSQKNNTVLSLIQSDQPEVKFLTVSSPASEKSTCGKDKVGNANFRIKSSTIVLGESKGDDVENTAVPRKQNHSELVSKTSQFTDDRSSMTTKEQLSDEDKNMRPDLDSTSLRDGCDTKYCPGGFLLSPTLSKSLQCPKVKISQNDSDSTESEDVKGSCVRVAQTWSKNDKVTEAIKFEHSDHVCTTSTLESKNSVIQSHELDKPTDDTCAQKDAIFNIMTENTKIDNVTTLEKNYIQKVPDQNQSPNARKSNHENTEVLTPSKTGEPVCETIIEKIPINIDIKNKTPCKDNLTQPFSKNTATKLTTSLTTTTTNSGSIMSSTSENSAKSSGFTNGIPDSENPFITWTKYDDDDDNDNYETVNASLPGLVHSLARVPFPLSLAVESSISHISPTHVAVPQLSPLALAGLSPGGGRLSISPSTQMPLLSSPDSRRLKSSPSHSHVKHPLSPTHIQLIHGCDENKASMDEDSTARPAHKRKRTSRLSNIIDSLRTSKEKQAAGSNQIFEDQSKKGALDFSAAIGAKSPSPGLSSIGHKSSSSSPVFSVPLGSDHRLSSENMFCDSLGFPHQFSPNVEQVMKSNLDAARAQTIDKSFNVLKDDLDKGKRMLESLETIKNGTLDPYSKSDSKSLKLDNNNSHNRSKSSSSLFSSSSTPSTTPSRPSSRQSAKSGSQIYPSASPLLPSSRSTSSTTASSNNVSSGISINSPMYHVAPSAALTAAHMELNAAAANILTFQHMYGMQDPYMMKTLISNPVYLQRMMEYQKQAMDPVMLRQIEMCEAATAAENSKTSKEQQAAMNAHSILWQAHAASIFQHQQMQQIQQLQLHHQQQQLQQQVAAARDRETRETIAAIITSNSLTTPSNKFSGSISTGLSSKSLTTLSTASSAQSSSKRPRSVATPSSMDIYSRDASSFEMKLRASHHASSHISNHNNYNSTTPALNAASLSLFRHAHLSNKLSNNNNSNAKPHTGSSTAGHLSKHEYINFPTALQLSSVASPHLWGFPTLLQPASLEMAHMAKFYEQASDAQSLSLAAGSTESEAPGTEVLDLSVRPKT